jgi:hypothetical protein
VGWKARVPLLAAALWWGSLTTIGFLVVPLLFQHADSARQAGQLAARMFGAGTWVSIGCGMLLLVAARTEDDEPRMDWAHGAMVFVVLGMLLALLAEFAVAPRIVARQNLAVWHGMGTALYAAQWLCALIVLWKLSLSRHSGEGS